MKGKEIKILLDFVSRVLDDTRIDKNSLTWRELYFYKLLWSRKLNEKVF